MSATAPATTRRTCEKHGDFSATAFEVPGMDIRIELTCPECSKELDAKRDAEARARREEELRRTAAALTSQSGIPRRFANAEFTLQGHESQSIRNAIEAAQAYATAFPAALRSGQGLVFVGPPGTGKTFTACAIALHAMCEFGKQALYTTAAEMARAMRASFWKGAELDEDATFAQFAAAPLLIIDEVGLGEARHDRELLFQVLDARYADLRPTVLVTNLTAPELEQYIGQRGMDRLVETCKVIPMTGSSRRRTQLGQKTSAPQA